MSDDLIRRLNLSIVGWDRGDRVSSWVSNKLAEESIAEIARLRAENERLKTMSTVEMMCENANVDSHVREWEKRCLIAEDKIADLERQLRIAGEEMGKLCVENERARAETWEKAAKITEQQENERQDSDSAPVHYYNLLVNRLVRKIANLIRAAAAEKEKP